ncbi:hypothetical protein L202_03200 [Cryptococcus amylolentus CBS 6039]|uniref:Uncharacterized protein n=1 Tax=Cryptococcus amylolentus CBS 6039 TaxID=1295533 RepID=A0A1E3HXX6_9TREE|nr:hypothetical protein L202_03200 [Cryptococcus amylolentus CBS 6039]ODN81107.1 hypothetical protein L202_03200 [Cryptococcus amylolentus CBS 6039]
MLSRAIVDQSGPRPYYDPFLLRPQFLQSLSARQVVDTYLDNVFSGRMDRSILIHWAKVRVYNVRRTPTGIMEKPVIVMDPETGKPEAESVTAVLEYHRQVKAWNGALLCDMIHELELLAHDVAEQRGMLEDLKPVEPFCYHLYYGRDAPQANSPPLLSKFGTSLFEIVPYFGFSDPSPGTPRTTTPEEQYPITPSTPATALPGASPDVGGQGEKSVKSEEADRVERWPRPLISR